MELRTVRNTSEYPQSVVFEQKQIILDPYTEATYPEDLAQMFLQIHPHTVSEVTEEFQDFQAEIQKPKTICIANLTGDDWDADEIKYYKMTPNGRVAIEVENPYKRPRELRYQHPGGEVFWTNKDGQLVSRNTLGREYKIPPYQVTEFPESIGRWLLNESAGDRIGERRALTRCAPLPEFRPTGKWKLDEIRWFYMLMVPGEDMRQVCKSESAIRRNSLHPEVDIGNAKRQLLKRLFFKFVRGKHTPPTKEQFDAYVTKRGETDAEKKSS